MNITALIQILQNFGFPIMVALWGLVFISKNLNRDDKNFKNILEEIKEEYIEIRSLLTIIANDTREIRGDNNKILNEILGLLKTLM